MKTLFVLIFLISAITQCQSDCRSTKDNKAECSSTKDLKNTSHQDKWTEIKVTSKSSETVEKNVLLNTPNVRKVIFKNNVNNIQNNAFQGASQLRAIHFFSCSLSEIKPLWFTSLPIEELIIYNSQVIDLRPGCLDNTPKLTVVNLSRNKILRIPTGVFSYLTVETLFLNDNQIETIEVDALYGMDHLKILALENNLLTSFESEKWFSNPNPTLYMLWLSKNKVKKITKNNFKLFPKLRILHLHFNNLETIEDGAFSGVDQLSYIDISNNKLTYLSPKVFPAGGLEYMDIFLIQNNRLSYLPTEIIAKFPRLTKMTIGGNPWQCPCYKDVSKFISSRGIRIICDNVYFKGIRPVCAVPVENSNKCIHNASISNELYPQFSRAQDEYDQLLPLCKIVCDDNMPCYANSFSNLQYQEI